MFKKILSIFETVGTARAANQLANMGYYDLARDLMLTEKSDKDKK